MVYLMLTRKVDLIFLCFSAPITSILCYRLTPGFFFNCYESFRMLKAFLAINKTQQRVPKQWHNCTVCGTVVTFQIWEDSAKLGRTFNKADELSCNTWKTSGSTIASSLTQLSAHSDPSASLFWSPNWGDQSKLEFFTLPVWTYCNLFFCY